MSPLRQQTGAGQEKAPMPVMSRPALGDARLHLVPGGHLLLLDSASDVLPVITDFLSAPAP